MYKNKRVCVVVPAYNEEGLIERVITTIPQFVDKIIVVDDRSKDATAAKVRAIMPLYKDRLVLICHEKNKGVGGAIVTGYKESLKLNMDISCVMAGDAQMDPEELNLIVDPVADGKADYAKGNRLIYGEAWKKIPKLRYLGNSVLSLLTKISSGYWHIADSQTGYTAISNEALRHLALDGIYKRYGYPNDLLVRLNVINCRIKDVSIKPIYNIGEDSGIRLYKVIPTLSLLLLKRFIWRLKEKYIIRDFHPLVFFYFMGFVLFLTGIFLMGLFIAKFSRGYISVPSVVISVFCLISSLQLILFAMWFDMDYNRDLKS
ncbi:MAG: glycosyltransferase family 2 protein [Candidatus Omnitrophica bacterium]|nr:glycosyltransferase family 2 protein [Candidatus Omnitrophota bacterium]MDD5552861.1 glycosyltransferase family 2 protein [Candidatus Omnitrophota bacterium]